MQSSLRRLRPGQWASLRAGQGHSHTITRSTPVVTSTRRNSGLAKVDVTSDGVAVDLGGASNIRRRVIPNLWLRDNCRCSLCVNQDTAQRNFDTFKIPRNIHPVTAQSEPEGLNVVWSDGNHKSTYPWDFISFYQSNDKRNQETVDRYLWGAEISHSPPTVAFEGVMKPDDTGVAILTEKLMTHGFVFIENTPFDGPNITKALLERIAFIRETHYGGFYDFTPNLALADTAYTNLALPAHTDTTYFSDPAGLQAFHLLSHKQLPSQKDTESPPGGRFGGESLLVDGFQAAKILKEEDPTSYDILSRVRLPWHASGNKGITISPDQRYPVFEHNEETGELFRIRWNNDDRGVVPFDKQYSPTEWYEAARKWDRILRSKKIEYWVQLEPGKPLVFDNWRVLHGRSAFDGIRRICGAYINRDDFISRWRNTNQSRSKILETIVG